MLGKPQVIFIMAIKRGGRGKGPTIKEKKTYFGTFKKILLPLKNEGIFTGLIQYFLINIAILVKIRFRLSYD